jgi:hypothetical protein
LAAGEHRVKKTAYEMAMEKRRKALEATAGELDDYDMSTTVEKEKIKSLSAGEHREKKTAYEMAMERRAKALEATAGELDDWDKSTRLEEEGKPSSIRLDPVDKPKQVKEVFKKKQQFRGGKGLRGRLGGSNQGKGSAENISAGELALAAELQEWERRPGTPSTKTNVIGGPGGPFVPVGVCTAQPSPGMLWDMPDDDEDELENLSLQVAKTNVSRTGAYTLTQSSRLCELLVARN